jgi:hypothetical protein
VADDESLPKTEPYTPNFDTGAISQPLEFPRDQPAASGRHAAPDPVSPIDAPSEPIPAPAQPVTLPGRYHFLRWWKLALLVGGVWVVAAPIGLALFYWWYHSINKTPAVFVVLVYVVVCTVAGLMLAMAQDRPLLSALAIAVMSALFASVAAAAPLYGFYYCQRMPHCLVGIIPY